MLLFTLVRIMSLTWHPWDSIKSLQVFPACNFISPDPLEQDDSWVRTWAASEVPQTIPALSSHCKRLLSIFPVSVVGADTKEAWSVGTDTVEGVEIWKIIIQIIMGSPHMCHRTSLINGLWHRMNRISFGGPELAACSADPERTVCIHRYGPLKSSWCPY